LERELDVELIAHASSAAVPTEASRAFGARARELVSAFDDAAAEMRRPRGARAGVRIGCVPDLPLQRPLAFLGALRVRASHLDAEVLHLPRAEQLRRLRVRTLDVGIVGVADDEPQLETAPLFPGEQLAVFLPIGHRLAERRSLQVGDLTGEQLITVPRDANPVLHDWLGALFDPAGCRVREASGADPRDLLLAVAEGAGIALAARSTAQVAGELATAVQRVALEPQRTMPDTTIAWSSHPPPELAELLAAVLVTARELRGS
jgi:DNA-binding transcriptional LysR family regulator